MKKTELKKIIKEEIDKVMKEGPKKKSPSLDSFVINGSEFKNKYATDFNGKVAKVLYKDKLNIGSNMGKGFYYNVTQDSLDIYSGKRDVEFDSQYAKYADKIIYKLLPDNIRIFVKEGISWDLWMDKNKEKLYESIKKIADGVYDPEVDDYGLLLFEDIE